MTTRNWRATAGSAGRTSEEPCKLFNRWRALRTKIIGIYAILIAINLGAWAWALLAFRDFPVLLGTALIAYGFGLRHAVDADHIAAIDNVTRKLMQSGRQSVAVGFFFALGHSSVVLLASALIAVSASMFSGYIEAARGIGGVIGTGVSALFLLAIALMNLLVLIGTYRLFRHVSAGGAYVEEDLDLLLAKSGFLARIFRPLFGLMSRSWHMYPLGFLFGLGFETATEISLLGMSAAGAAKGMSIWSIMVFPTLFAAGMLLIDTTDGVLMLGAYGWAFIKPIRKLYYNMTITFVSVIAALLVGGLEALGLLGTQLELKGMFWEAIAAINENFGSLGYLIIGVFIVSWLGSIAIYRLRRYDELDINPSEGGIVTPRK